MTAYNYFVLFGLTQIVHSQEEIWNNFHKRWFVFTMPRWLFITLESFLSLTIIAYIIKSDLPLANWFMALFAFIMLINGVGHIVWGLVTKKYVPGLVTAPVFIVIFSFYYLSLIK